MGWWSGQPVADLPEWERLASKLPFADPRLSTAAKSIALRLKGFPPEHRTQPSPTSQEVSHSMKFEIHICELDLLVAWLPSVRAIARERNLDLGDRESSAVTI
jgi:hypothetical protein